MFVLHPAARTSLAGRESEMEIGWQSQWMQRWWQRKQCAYLVSSASWDHRRTFSCKQKARNGWNGAILAAFTGWPTTDLKSQASGTEGMAVARSLGVTYPGSWFPSSPLDCELWLVESILILSKSYAYGLQHGYWCYDGTWRRSLCPSTYYHTSCVGSPRRARSAWRKASLIDRRTSRADWLNAVAWQRSLRSHWRQSAAARDSAPQHFRDDKFSSAVLLFERLRSYSAQFIDVPSSMWTMFDHWLYIMQCYRINLSKKRQTVLTSHWDSCPVKRKRGKHNVALSHSRTIHKACDCWIKKHRRRIYFR